MNRIFRIILYLILINISVAQSLESSFPFGYSVFDSLSFDYNKDKILDKILVFDNVVNTRDTLYWRSLDRPFIILKGIDNQNFELAVRNDSLIIDREFGGMGGDPYNEIFVSDSSIYIHYFARTGWYWSKLLEFIFNPNKNMWYLRKYEYSEGSINSLDSASYYEQKDFDEIDSLAINNYNWKK